MLNAIPVFMPPTWSLLARFHLRQGMPIVPLAAVGALAAVTGRAILALSARAFGTRFLSRQRQESIEALAGRLRERKGLSFSLLALFAAGPIPTNHLFIAAGIARIPLPPVLAVFGVTRFFSYIFWVAGVETAAHSLRDVITPSLGNGAALAVLLRLDWPRLLIRWFPRRGSPHPPTDRPER
jgi:membrane protein YqaA with SNARE-associated domain